MAATRIEDWEFSSHGGAGKLDRSPPLLRCKALRGIDVAKGIPVAISAAWGWPNAEAKRTSANLLGSIDCNASAKVGDFSGIFISTTSQLLIDDKLVNRKY